MINTWQTAVFLEDILVLSIGNSPMTVWALALKHVVCNFFSVFEIAQELICLLKNACKLPRVHPMSPVVCHSSFFSESLENDLSAIVFQKIVSLKITKNLLGI